MEWMPPPVENGADNDAPPGIFREQVDKKKLITLPHWSVLTFNIFVEEYTKELRGEGILGNLPRADNACMMAFFYIIHPCAHIICRPYCSGGGPPGRGAVREQVWQDVLHK